MTFLIDSDFLIDILKGDHNSTLLFQSIPHEDRFISVISYGELYEGVLFSANRAKHETAFSGLISIVTVLGIDTETMSIFAELRGTLARSGNRIGDLDLMIGATAVQHELTLVTRNRRHFARIKGLRLHEASMLPE